MSHFSGAIKIADGLDDYLAPAQNCVLPMGNSTNTDKLEVSNVQDSLDFTDILVNVNTNIASKRRLGSTVGGTSSIEGANFGQIQNTDSKATITLNDCLACSGCVTSAETILITQQSGVEFFRILSEIQNHTSSYKYAIVTISPQSLLSFAETFELPIEIASIIIEQFFLRLGVVQVLGTYIGQEIALYQSIQEFLARYSNKYLYGNDDGNLIDTQLQMYSYPQSHTHTNNNATTKDSSTTDTSNRIVQDTSRHTEFQANSYSSRTLPLISSECPGWTVFAEKTQGEKCIQYMSSIATPIEILGNMIKHTKSIAYNTTTNTDTTTSKDPTDASVHPSEIYHVTITPCYDKKLEAARQQQHAQELSTSTSTSSGSTSSSTSTNTELDTTSAGNTNTPNVSGIDLVLSTTELIDMLLGKSTIVNESGALETVENQHTESSQIWNTLMREYIDTNTIQPSSSTSTTAQSFANIFTQTTLSPTLSLTRTNSNSNTALGYRQDPYSKIRIKGDGLSGNYAYHVFVYTCAYIYNIANMFDWLELPWCQGNNSDITSVALEYVGNTNTHGVYITRGKQSTIVYGRMLTKDMIQNPMFKRNLKYKTWYRNTDATTNTDITTALDTEVSFVTRCATPVTLLWVSRAYGFRNIQNVIKPGSANYDYIEVMACPSGCVNGGGQIRAIDMPQLREYLWKLLYTTEQTQDTPVPAKSITSMYKRFKNEDNGGNATSVTDPTSSSSSSQQTDDASGNNAVVVGSTLSIQKKLTENLLTKYLALPVENTNTTAEIDTFVSHIQQYYMKSTGVDLKALFYTQFKSLATTQNLTVIPKW